MYLSDLGKTLQARFERTGQLSASLTPMWVHTVRESLR